MALRDEDFKGKALEIENPGVNVVCKTADETIVKIISNGMVDINCYVDFDAEASAKLRECSF